MSLELLNYHLRMLGDPVRIAAWKEAISRSVMPGNVVVDIGAGAGVLALLACEAGARRVYALEESGVIEAAREIANQDGYGDRITFFRGHSSAFQPSERADVVLGDLLGVFGVTGGIGGVFADARDRLLKPGGLLLPASIEMFAAPVELPEWYRSRIDAWRGVFRRFEYPRCRERAVNQMHQLSVSAGDCLASPSSLGRLELGDVPGPEWRGRFAAPVSREGLMHGIAGWCRCEYAPGIAVSNSPFEDRRTVWQQAVLPVERTVVVQPGDCVEAEIFYDNPSRWTVLRWKVRVLTRGEIREQFRHSTFHGEFLSPERIRAIRPSFKPPAPRRDRAARRVLDLCDGEHTLAGIQSELQREFPSLFQTPAAAFHFIRRIIDAAGD